MKFVNLVLIFIMIFSIFSCAKRFDQYKIVSMEYNTDLVNSELVFISEDLYFEPINGFQFLPEHLLEEYLESNQPNFNDAFYEMPIAVFLDSLSQMIIISEIKSGQNNSVEELFLNSMQHYSNIYKDKVLKALPYKYEDYLINQFVISHNKENIMVKLVISYLNDNKLKNIYMLDYYLSSDDFSQKMRGVESSIASLKKIQIKRG